MMPYRSYGWSFAVDETTLVMSKERLLPLPATDGMKFIQALDKKGFNYKAAFWLYQSEIDDWRLYIVTPLVDEIGQKEAYLRIHAILYGLHPPIDLSLSYITLVSPSDPFYQILHKVYHVEPEQPPVYVRRSMFEGIVIEEALIYRML